MSTYSTESLKQNSQNLLKKISKLSGYDYKNQTNAKWILTGEHSVVVNNKAIAAAFKEASITLIYTKDTTLKVSAYGLSPALVLNAFDKIIYSLIKIFKINITGSFVFYNNIPIGAGLGFSAAICLSVAKYLNEYNFINKEDILSLAIKLEDSFHHKSSGLDVYTVNQSNMIIYQNGQSKILKPNWQPTFGLKYLGSKSYTYDIVKKVLNSKTKEQGYDLMYQSFDNCLSGLLDNNIEKLVMGIKNAKEAFSTWKLLTKEYYEVEKELMANKALACKPTGAGYGGFVLVLFEEKNLMLENIIWL